MDEMLKKRLEPVLFRIRIRRVAIALGLIWLAAASAGAWFYFLNQSNGFDTSQVIWLILGGTVVASLIALFHAIFNAKRISQVVEDLEREFPDLDSSLMTAIDLRPEPGQRLGFLQQDVLRQAVTHSYVNRWPSIIPGWQLVAAPLAGVFGFLAFAAMMICLVFFTKPTPVDETIQFAEAAVDFSDFEISVEPGNTEIERGTSLLVLARFAKSFPPDATLVFADEQGVESRLPMSKSLDDPVFGARISSVNQPITYRVEFAKQESNPFDVDVFDFPRLVRADAKLKYPEYTQLEDKIVQDIRRLNAVEGTTAELSFFVNKPLVGAVLAPRGDDEDLKPIPLNVDPDDPKKITATIPMQRSRKLELILLDGDNRENRSPPKFVLNVLQNRPPELKLLAPGRDVEASPIEEVQLSASAWDDFGLKKFGVHFGIIGEEPQEVILEQKSLGKKRKQVDHLLELEKMKAEPDNLVSYYFFAEDIGPDGEDRMVASDMYFAEVRHFEEIFRQGEAPPQGQQQPQQQQQQQQGQNAQQAQELAELQKDIINGTWKVIRREKKKSLSELFGEDLDLLVESQNAAIAQLTELAENVEDEKSLAHVEAVRTFMNEAVLHLTQANNDANVDDLKPALSTEQAAYQGLLKLRAREHEVVRQQQQQQQQASQQQRQNNRAQQQLNDLELKQDENRYENEKTAQEQTQQDEAASEDRQVLNRLRELARRQSDLNERVKELQSALEEAETEEEREEIERRLKSLREQQEQMLRDAEELAERMQTEENQQRMSEESDQLEKTRESLQRANEALEKNEVSRAAAEGTRAQRELEDLRDEFQNRTAGQFTEQMRQMRNEAQELEEKEQEIADALAGQSQELPNEEDKNKSPSLRETEDQKPDVQKQLADQKEAVEKLRDKMKETIEEAETFEPLLAEDLYETYRDSEETRPDQALDSARQSLNRGWVDDARKEEQRARTGITQMREGIEKAAESVLGDETEGLKAAQDTLRELNRDLNQELQDKAPGRQGEQDSNQDEQDREGQPGEREGQSDQEPKEGNGRQNGERPSDQEREGQQPQEGQRGQGEPQEGQQPQEGQRGQGEPQEGQQPQEGQRGQGEPQEGQQPQEGQRGQGEPQEGQQPQEGQRGQGESQEGQQPQEGQQGGGGGRNDDQQSDAERLRQQMRNLNNSPRNNDGQIGGAPNQEWNGGDQRMRPISGDDFRDWSDRLRDVEEMIADPDLRAEASRIREQAREIRKDMKRHSEEPNWELVKLKVAKPLAELQDRVAEELMRRSSKDVLIPLDRDPVPAEYQDAVRRYYERLGSGQ